MGEAKRRKQALGTRYGKTPPVLINGSEQLDEHIEKFANAYFDKFGQDNQTSSSASHLEEQNSGESEILNENASHAIKMEQWVKEYLEPYRHQDRNKLSKGLLDPFFYLLFENPDDYPDQETDDEMTTFMFQLIGALTSYSNLKTYLTEEEQELYAEPLRILYFDMLEDIEDQEIETGQLSDTPEKLTRLFQSCLDEDEISEYL